ncbi:hypothetical protein AB6Q56_00330 [Dechloromonas sp. ARDL1]|uniref:hypothetical protein n=1 Tax=Dechloromonas sp. ARDL1 TaxID=3322121 RepID=UPI003DA747A5
MPEDIEESSVRSMTVNERLFHFGLFEPFDAAARARDVPLLTQVLLQAKLSKKQALQTAEAIVAAPKRYGF